MTGSNDKTVQLWDVNTGVCTQVLEGHEQEIFSCSFNYEGDTIITASKDNTCRIWKDKELLTDDQDTQTIIQIALLT